MPDVRGGDGSWMRGSLVGRSVQTLDHDIGNVRYIIALPWCPQNLSYEVHASPPQRDQQRHQFDVGAERVERVNSPWTVEVAMLQYADASGTETLRPSI